MLKLILGRAKTGKTHLLIDELRAASCGAGESCVMIVPEQYSHEAEREALSACGDSFSLFAEVLSFSRLASRVEGELGSSSSFLTKGSKLLCMALALDAVGSRLAVYSSARRKVELQQNLILAIDELKASMISAEALLAAAQGRSDNLGNKLRDLSLLYEAYDAHVSQSGADPADRLLQLAHSLERSKFSKASFFVDGFTDFTAQEVFVIERLLKLGARVTICLTCEGFEEAHEIFEPSRKAALKFKNLAEGADISLEVQKTEAPETLGPMLALEKSLFSFDAASYDDEGAVSLFRGGSIAAECEAAAARCAALVREGSCHYRDIAIAVRGYDSYAAQLSAVMAHYEIPLYSAIKADIMQMPLPMLLSGAFDIVSGGFAYEDVIGYLRCGLSGLSADECDLLDSYAFLWSLRGSAWYGDAEWSQHPDGYGHGELSPEARSRLLRLGELRRRAITPLYNFQKAGAAAKTAREQAKALAAFFAELDLSQTLAARSRELHELGLSAQAAQYSQLWGIIVEATEACAAILGEMLMTQEEFGRLFCLMLGSYEVGTIPLSLDSVSAGDFDRMRRRSIKHLIVLGCDSSAVPSVGPASGIFSDEDREELTQKLNLEIGDTAPSRLCREYALAYNCMTLPETSLFVSYRAAAGEEGSKNPSFVMSRLAKIFGKEIESIDLDLCREAAPNGVFELAAAAFSPNGDARAAAARDYLLARGERDDLERIRAAAQLSRGKLSPQAATQLYGEELRLSASRIDRFSSCRFSYFLQYGLRAKPRQAASFSPPEMGTFMHYVLEGVAAKIEQLGGFKVVTPEQAQALCATCVNDYAHEYLNDFREKSGRFVYLFKRLASTVKAVVADMAAELARSDFSPLDFELDFGDASVFPPLATGDGKLYLTGIADRVDGYYHNGKLYARVVDYKTGVKAFSLSDVWHGMGLQMLLYLFALSKSAGEKYGAEIVPAGVLYVPAREVLLSEKSDLPDDEISKRRAAALRRSGLLLDDAQILNAMEHGDNRYIPVKLKSGEYSGDSLASLERLGLLFGHIEKTLAGLASELRCGSIAADPYFRSASDNACTHCDYSGACHFDEVCDSRRYLARLGTQEVWARLENSAKEDA